MTRRSDVDDSHPARVPTAWGPDALRSAYRGLGTQLREAAGWFATEVDARRELARLGGRPLAGVALLGSGDAAFPGAVCAAIASPVSPVPVVAVGEGPLPAWIGGGALVVAVAPGDDDPQGTATRDVREAAARGAAVVVIGGLGAPHLHGELAATGAIVLEAPWPVGHARACTGLLAAPLLLLAQLAGVLPGASHAIAVAADQALRRRAELAWGQDGTAHCLARRLARTVPLFWGPSPIGALAASRFKAAVNENAKSPAWSAGPRFAYEEACGFGQNGDVTRQLVRLVVLCDDHGEAFGGGGIDVIEDLLGEVVAGIEVVRAEGEGPLAQLLDLVQVADATSLELAALEGVDPGPTPAARLVLGS